MIRSTGRAGAVARLLTLAVLLSMVTGCTSNAPPPPEPTSDPGPRYQAISRDLCERMRLEKVAGGFDLALAPRHDPSGSYFVRDSYWDLSCTFDAERTDDRFATHVTPRFDPGGLIIVSVFRELANAQAKYGAGTRGFEQRRESLDATLQPVEGWWDEGEYSESIRNEGPYSYEDAEDVYGIDVHYVVRHANLYMETRLDAISYPEDVEDVTAVLHELVKALLDEAVSHLTRTE